MSMATWSPFYSWPDQSSLVLPFPWLREASQKRNTEASHNLQQIELERSASFVLILINPVAHHLPRSTLDAATCTLILQNVPAWLHNGCHAAIICQSHPPKKFWALKDGHYCRKCPSLRAQKWHFGCPKENSETTFISPTSPKMMELHLVSSVFHFWMGFQPI